MTGLLLLIPVALGLGLLGLLAFIWCLRNAQYDDLEGAANRILLDESAPPPPPGVRQAVAEASPDPR
ncbi:MAG: cbb3-type cytochrome oxidase assembly protein CcoS [Rhizobiales bacterium]|nr:cbb3-type cytochrome oxidase assembly protein CcoS [Hyphomicrobiales bacterium]